MADTFAVIGSGFGLYGYLPALASSGKKVILPRRYQARLEARAELAGFVPAVRWARDETEALANADGAVIALRSEDQPLWIARCIANDRIAQVLLEKPLAPNPAAGARLIADLLRAKTTFRIAYIFRQTPWGKALLEALLHARSGAATLQWRFTAHHFVHDLRNWKRFHAQGGGAIRFFGIHAIALLAELGYERVERSDATGASADEVDRWSAVFVGSNRPDFHLLIESRSAEKEFSVRCNSDTKTEEVSFAMRDPFCALGDAKSNLDRRIPILREVLQSLSDGNARWVELYERTNSLWREVEERTMIKGTG